MSNKLHEPIAKVTDSPWVTIEQFLQTAVPMYNMDYMQVAGFKSYMQGKSRLPQDVDFIPYLKKYLDKEC